MTYQTETSDFLDDVDAAGGFVSTRTLDLLDAFVVAGKADGWWTAIGQLWIPVGDFAASKIAFLGPTMTFNNFVAADYKEATGYVLRRNLNKYIQTGFVPNSNSVTSSSMTMALVCSMPKGVNGVESAYLLGCDPASGSTDPSPHYDGNYYGYMGIAASNKRVEGPIPAHGDIAICRYGSGNRTSFGNGVRQWKYTNAVASTAMTTEVTLFRTTRADDAVYYSPGGFQFYMIGTEISEALCFDLNAAIKTLMEGLRSSFAPERLVTFGDSIGQGSLATNYTLHDRRFSALVANDLGLIDANNSNGSRRLSTDIANIPAGITIYDDMIDGESAYVIVQLGVNDKRSDPLKSTTGTSATITSITTNLNTILAALIADNKRCVCVGPNYGTTADCGSDECQLAYSAAASSAAKTNSVAFVDAFQLFDDTADPDNDLLADTIHPNDDGHRLLADAIVLAFQGYLYRNVSLDFGSISAGGTASLSFRVSGASSGMAVTVTPPSAIESGLTGTATVTDDDEVTLIIANASGGAINPAAAYWSVKVLAVPTITQTLEFSGGAGLPIYGKLFASETDTVLATRNAIEKTNDAGRFQLIVFDNAAGEYRLNGFVNLVGGSVNENYDLLAVTDTYLPRSETRASGGDSNSAEIITGVLDGLESVTINRISPFNPLTSAYTLIKDDDYVFENGTHEDFNLTDTGIDLENATATVSARSTRASCSSQFDGVATIVDADTESPKLRIEWPDAGTDAEIGSNYIWQAKVVDNATNKKTEFEGPLTLKLSSDQ